MRNSIGRVALLLLFALLTVGAGSSECAPPSNGDDTAAETPEPTPVPTATVVPTPEPPKIEELTDTITANMVEGYLEVLDAAITQDGRTLSLVLVVANATSQSRAQELGDNFVRMTKSLLQDGDSPSRQIGRGEYDYLIGVYSPNEDEIAFGAKLRAADRITW